MTNIRPGEILVNIGGYIYPVDLSDEIQHGICDNESPQDQTELTEVLREAMDTSSMSYGMNAQSLTTEDHGIYVPLANGTLPTSTHTPQLHIEPNHAMYNSPVHGTANSCLKGSCPNTNHLLMSEVAEVAQFIQQKDNSDNESSSSTPSLTTIDNISCLEHACDTCVFNWADKQTNSNYDTCVVNWEDKQMQSNYDTRVVDVNVEDKNTYSNCDTRFSNWEDKQTYSHCDTCVLKWQDNQQYSNFDRTPRKDTGKTETTDTMTVCTCKEPYYHLDVNANYVSSCYTGTSDSTPQASEEWTRQTADVDHDHSEALNKCSDTSNTHMATQVDDATTDPLEYHNANAKDTDTAEAKAVDCLRDTASKRRSGSKRPRGCKIWEYIRDLLLDTTTNPSLIRWEDQQLGTFRIVQPDTISRMWGMKKGNQCMNYEKLSRAMRYHYKKQVLAPVKGKNLIYRFGPTATGWR